MQDAHTEIFTTQPKIKNSQRSKKLKEPENVSDKDDGDLINQLKKWTDDWYSYWNEPIQNARELLLFLFISQWDPEVKLRRQNAGIPTLSFNHIAPMIDSILGEQRKNSAQISIISLDQDDTQKKTDWRTDLMRQICYSSQADNHFQMAYFQQLTCGWGFVRVSVHYEGNDTFRKCVRIGGDADYQKAFWDPTAKEKHKQDGDYCGIYQVMSMDDFKRDYPDIANPVSAGQQTFFSWQTRETITVCEIYYKDYYKKTIVQLSDNREMELSDAKKLIEAQASEVAEDEIETNDIFLMQIEKPEPLEIINQRDVMCYKMKHVRYVENALVDKTDWPGKMLPIVFFPGQIAVIDGKENPISFINNLQDPQRLYNYVMSEMATGMLNTQRSKVIATPDMTKGHEQAWRQPQKVQGALHYNPDNRTQAGRPEFIDPPPFNQALIGLQQIANQEMPTISGRFEENRGQESNAVSGKAIKARISVGNNVVNVFHDNLLSGIEQVARVGMDLLPHVYIGEREVMLREMDGTSYKMTINKATGRYKMPNVAQTMKFEDLIDSAEEEIENKLDDGEFNIEVKAVGSLDYQKEESMNFWLSMMSVDPRFPGLMADLVAEESDATKAKQISERLKSILPPDILAKENGQPPPPPQADPAAQMAQQKMQLEIKNMALKEQQMQVDMQMKQGQQQIDQMSMQNDRMKMILDAQQNGLDAQVAREQAEADIHTTHVKANAEVEKANLARDTAHIVHHTHRMKEISKLQQNTGFNQ